LNEKQTESQNLAFGTKNEIRGFTKNANFSYLFALL